MPIYAPTLPPKPDLNQGEHPVFILATFDLSRIWRHKLGRFFGFVFFGILAIQITVIYTKYLVDTSAYFEQTKGLAGQLLPEAATLQASLLHSSVLIFLWFQVAVICGGLIARDTLYRIRPLIYAHPVRPNDYLVSKALVAFGIPFCVQLPFIILPWLLSMLIAGTNGPIWPIAPLYLIPAAVLNSMIMASVTLGASSLASTPKAGMSWMLGLILGPSAVGGILSGIFSNPSWMALSPVALTESWPKLLCGVGKTAIPLWPTITATTINICLWVYVAKWRTTSSEAVI